MTCLKRIASWIGGGKHQHWTAQGSMRRFVVVTVTAIGLIILGSAPAEAAGFGVVKTGGALLRVRADTNTNSQILKRLKSGTRVKMTCHQMGQVVSGTFGRSNIWDRLSTGGYVPDS